MSSFYDEPPADEVLVYTLCGEGQSPPEPAKLVFTLCSNCKCPPGPAVKVYTLIAPRGPGAPLKFELDQP